MSKAIRKELLVPQAKELVWKAVTDRDTLAEWMYPNDFEPRVGHRFTFRVPPNPEYNFDGLTVYCEVLECDAPERLVFSWTAGGPVVDTRVTFRLVPEGEGTRIFFEHGGFDLTQPWAEEAFKGAEYGWAGMLEKLSSVVAGPGVVVSTGRLLSASPAAIFAAFEKPDLLARWWGPKGFTNTFETFDFQPGGKWIFVMHGPNGSDYPNESVFRENEPGARVVIEHVVEPWFRLTVTLTPVGGQTQLSWDQEFDSPELAKKMRALSETANEEVLDRLEALLAEKCV